ncbi:hypothetical protein [Niveispirillum sp. KHB5.9]|uniref:hypothetical protein n=1 Tax=Niveispirillum sp. KHB5.9 TaxID=3400269 RepID=UPI003A868952
MAILPRVARLCIARLPAALIAGGLLMVISTAGAVGTVLETIGPANGPEVALLIANTPTTMDSAGNLRPALRQWIGHIATQGEVHVSVRTVTVDQRQDEALKSPGTCAMSYARLPAREDKVRWLAEVKRDRMVFIARRDDPFQGSLSDFLRITNGKLGAPSGIYRDILENRGIRHTPVDDQLSLARMVEAGEPRFGLLIGGAMHTPEIRAMAVRVVAELPQASFWFACSAAMPDMLSTRLAAVLHTKEAEALRREALGNLAPARSVGQ